jgi:hypothetical protein
MEDKLIYTVIHDILQGLNIKGKWKEMTIDEIDGILELEYNGKKAKFNVEAKKEVRNYHLHKIFQLAEYYKPLMVITEKNIFPAIKDEFRRLGIAFIDLNGNVNIETETLLIKVEGKQQKYLQPEKQGRAFTKAGLKAIFLFLQNEEMINETYREIAKNTGIALGNVKYILEGLKEEGFVLKKTEKTLYLVNKKELLEKWLTAYDEKLKPALHIGNFNFIGQEDFRNWKNLKLNEDQTVWGGEAAGDIITGYLIPEILTLYTNEKRVEIMKKYKLVPDIKGNIKIYEKFWNYETGFKQTVPPLLAYADLMNTGDGRCIETAQKIYEQHIKHTIQ